jgi:hypothetical protein
MEHLTAKRYGSSMGLLEAAAWGSLGGIAAGLIALASAIAARNNRLPPRRERWARVVVGIIGIGLGAMVAGAAHSQLAGELPALIMGASAPSVFRGALGRVEVGTKGTDDTV